MQHKQRYVYQQIKIPRSFFSLMKCQYKFKGIYIFYRQQKFIQLPRKQENLRKFSVFFNNYNSNLLPINFQVTDSNMVYMEVNKSLLFVRLKTLTYLHALFTRKNTYFYIKQCLVFLGEKIIKSVKFGEKKIDTISSNYFHCTQKLYKNSQLLRKKTIRLLTSPVSQRPQQDMAVTKSQHCLPFISVLTARYVNSRR